MQFKQGASIMTWDGKEAGHIDRVVIDPKTNEVTHLVIRRGLLQKVDKVVPVTAVTSGRGGVLTLHLDSDKWGFLPDFAEERYILVDEGQGGGTPSALFSYPPYPGGVPGMVNYSPKYVAETHLNIPDKTVALKEGAKVITRDHKEVGHVAQILVSTPDDQVTHFLIAKGLLVKEQRLIPVDWVERLAEDEVYLAIDSSMVERLPVIESV